MYEVHNLHFLLFSLRKHGLVCCQCFPIPSSLFSCDIYIFSIWTHVISVRLTRPTVSFIISIFLFVLKSPCFLYLYHILNLVLVSLVFHRFLRSFDTSCYSCYIVIYIYIKNVDRTHFSSNRGVYYSDVAHIHIHYICIVLYPLSSLFHLPLVSLFLSLSLSLYIYIYVQPWLDFFPYIFLFSILLWIKWNVCLPRIYLNKDISSTKTEVTHR